MVGHGGGLQVAWTRAERCRRCRVCFCGGVTDAYFYINNMHENFRHLPGSLSQSFNLVRRLSDY